MFRWSGKINPKIDSTTVVSSIDIASTIMGICDIEPPVKLPGLNVLDEEALKIRGPIFAETYAHDFSSIDSSLYYRIGIDFPYKLILPDKYNKPENVKELYNLADDPYENQNLVTDYPEKADELEKKIESWWEAGEN